jgi:hypothetical protein
MRLLGFVPCERVIISQENTPTLISVIETVTIGIAGVELPENSAVPMLWHVFTMWRADDSDINQRFDQKCTLVDPNGRCWWRRG